GQVPLAAQRHTAFEQADRVAEFSLGDMEIGKSPVREGQTVGVIERLSEAEGFLALGDPFLELSQVSEHPRRIGTDEHGRESGKTKPFPAPVAFKQLQGLQEKVLGLAIVARPEADRAEVEIPRHLERNIPKRLGDSLGVLAERKRFRRMTSFPEGVAHMDGHLAESPLIIDPPGQPFGFAEIAEDPLEFSERKERSLQVEAKIDGSL